MATFRSLTDEFSMPHFENDLHHTATRFPERSSLQSGHEGFRQMLPKEGRERIPELPERHLPSASGRDLVINDLHSRQRSDDAEDARDMDDKVSLLNREVGSMKMRGPTWLSSALLKRHQSGESFLAGDDNRKWCGCEAGSHCVQCSFLHLQTQPATRACSSGIRNRVSSTQWIATPMAMIHEVQPPVRMADAAPCASVMRLSTQQSHGSADDINPSCGPGRGLHDLHSDTANSSDLVEEETKEHDNRNWRSARLKADILSHPLYEQLLAAHVACLRIATPVEQLPRIDAQLAQSHHVLAKYSVLGQNHLLMGEEKDELDQFMTHYVLLLCSFKEQLQHHVRVHAMEAVMACWQLEQSLLNLTGVSPGEGTGATMSDDDDDHEDSVPGPYDTVLDGQDTGGFGPLIPTETERSLMERVRQELKNDLKQGYRNRIVDVREEILRKRRAGKLPGDTTSVLKSWWHAHSKWPYPTEDEKARLVQETGLQLKQINNWFINQRKRNWHSNPSSSSTLKSKRKR